MDDEKYVINDLDLFIDASRTMVFQSFGQAELIEAEDLLELSDKEKEQLDSSLSFKESMIIAHKYLKKERNKKTGEERYAMTSEIYENILQDLNSRLVSNILNSLANKGLIETCYDTEKDDWAFYIAKNKNDKNEEKPETD